MKKSVVLLGILLLCFFSMAWANEEAQTNEKTVSTLGVMKQNWIQPEHGDGFFSEGITLWWHHRSNIGLGMDVDLVPKTNYQRYRAYLNYNHNNGPWYPLVGASTDSLGNDYVQTGLWYFKKHGQTEVFVDERIYWSIDGKSQTYSDLFVEVVHPLPWIKNTTAGINASYDHWFSRDQHDWFMVGPVVYFRNLLGKGATPYIRIVHEFDVKQGEKVWHSNDYRLGIKFSF